VSAKGAVLLTGGTGFVGSTLAPRLKARGWRVHALARRTSDSSTIAEHVDRWHTGDMTDGDSLARAVAALAEEPGESWCCHLGAMISYRPRDRALQQRVNVEGTGALVDALVEGGVPRLLHVSSTAAVGVAASAKEELDESSSFESLRRIGAAYPLTKRAAEERALGDPRLERVVATNPGAIFGGGGVHNNSTKFLGLPRGGRRGGRGRGLLPGLGARSSPPALPAGRVQPHLARAVPTGRGPPGTPRPGSGPAPTGLAGFRPFAPRRRQVGGVGPLGPRGPRPARSTLPLQRP
jgi:nucleoside-diphosphate-sugar epimerase